MPLPQWLARANRVGLNRVVNRIGPRAPGLGVVVHRGRASGRVYRTPVNVFRRGDGFVIPLTYGSDSDWVRNVVTAGGCELETAGRRYVLDAPRVYRDDDRAAMPPVIRQLLGAFNVAEFLALRAERTDGERLRSGP